MKRQNLFVFLFVFPVIPLLCSASVLAQNHHGKRLALVVGNNAYTTSPLKNAVNDAHDMANALEAIGFSVTLLNDTNKTSLELAVDAYYKEVRTYTHQKVLSLFYYAGHAVQISHRNYLVPLDYADGNGEFVSSLFDINSLLDLIPRQNDISNIIILDACRDNPLAEQTPLSGDGLAPLRAPPATLIAYSTEPGNVAEDGQGDNGLYTSHLLDHIKQKIPVEEIFRKVRKKVARDTGNRQIPWEHSSLIDEIYINQPPNKDIPNLMTF